MRTISDIAYDITKDWKDVNFAAKPYLHAMCSLDSLSQDYGLDSAYSIIVYFLCNASSWRGPVARQIKTELRNMLNKR